MAVKPAASSSLPNKTLTTGGFGKLPFIVTNDRKEKVRLYHIGPQSKAVEAAKKALENKVKNMGGTYTKKWESFKDDIQKSPYLLKEGKTYSLLSEQEAIKLQLKYGVIGSKIETESKGALKLLETNKIETDQQFVAFYNQSTPEVKDDLLPLINTMFYIFSNERTVLTQEEVKTVSILGQCDHEGIQNGALTLLMSLFEKSDFLDDDSGFGLKYLLDKMPVEFFKKNQLLLLNIFDKLSSRLSNILHSGKSVNHEIEPLIACLISVGRALVKSDLEKLNKETKDKFYEKLKDFYSNEQYSKRIEALEIRTNYLLVHSSLWIIQHLVRIISSESKVVKGLRKAFHGVVAAKTLAGAPLKAAVKVFHGEIPDEAVIHDLKTVYEHGKEAFGFKDIPRAWYELLEETEKTLLDSQLSESNLQKLVELIEQYDDVKNVFNQALVATKIVGVTQESEEFVFGFVKQLSDVAMDHQHPAVRAKALEILEKIFDKKKQSENVRLLILMTLQNIIARKDPMVEQVKAIQERLLQRKKELKGMPGFRQFKYPCLTLIPGGKKLLEAAKRKLLDVSKGQSPFPMSKFVYGSEDIQVYEKKITVKKFSLKGPAPLTAEELENAVKAAEKIHLIAFDNNGKGVTLVTKMVNATMRTFKKEIIADEFDDPLTAQAKSLLASRHLPASPSPIQPKPSEISILAVTNSKDLGRALCQANPSPMAEKILHQMVNIFTNQRFPSEEAIQEITILLDNMTTHDGFRAFNSLMSGYNDAALKDEKSLQAIIKIFSQFQKSYYQRIYQNQNNLADPTIDALKHDHLIQILKVLTGHLREPHQQKENSLVHKQLVALITLLDIMTVKQVQGIDHILLDEAYTAINNVKSHGDLNIVYLIEYAKQLFNKLPSDQSKLKSAFNRGFLIARGIARLADTIEIEKPWKMAFKLPLAIIEAYPDFADAFSNIHALKKDWFLHLFKIRSLIVDPHQFLTFLKALDEKYETVQEDMDFHDTFLVKGWIEILWNILHYPIENDQDKEIQCKAIKLFEKIYLNNRGNGKDLPFSVDNDQQKEQLRALILLYLNSCTLHPQKEVKGCACQILASLKLKDLPTHIPFSSVDKPTELFKDAASKNLLFLTLQRIRNKFFQDDQLNQEKPYYIFMDALVEKTHKIKNFKEEFESFLTKDNPVMTVEGEGGAGKTLTLKILAAELLEKYQTEKDYFPIFFPLSSLKNPAKAWRKAISENGISPSEESELKTRKLVVVFDAFDEIKFERKKNKEEGREANLYQVNRLNEWKNLKCVISFKGGTVQPSQFQSLETDPFPKSFILQGFERSKIFQYLNNYFKLFEKKNKDLLLLRKEDYEQVFNELLGSDLEVLISNPLRLKIAMEALPGIVREYKKENPTKKDLKGIFEGKASDLVKWQFFRDFVLIAACRSQIKVTRAGGNIKAFEFIEYSAEVAKRMFQLGQLRAIPWPTSKENIRKKFSDMLSSPPNILQKECLIHTLEGWSFLHDIHRLNFTTLAQRPQDLERFKILLTNQFYQDFFNKYATRV